MAQLLTSAQMRALEAAEIESGTVTGGQLMERAGRGALDKVFLKWPDLAQGQFRACILCGPGNNGGDGFVIARRLADRGWDVDVFLYGDAAKLPPDAKANYVLWSEMGMVTPLIVEALRATERPDLFVDAVFGTGLTRALPNDLAEALDVKMMKTWTGGAKIRRLAIDAPSGLNLDNGLVPASAHDQTPNLNSAHLTVTFHALKVGHKLALGPILCGDVHVVDIGLKGPDAAERAMIGTEPDTERARLAAPDFMHRDIPRRIWPGAMIPKLRGRGHKYEYGHALVFAGGSGRGGAGRLAARSALRAGAGLVTVLCPSDAMLENACQLNAIMLRACDDPNAFKCILDDRVSSICLGPGMGVGPKTRDMVEVALSHDRGARARRLPAVVLDADALTSFEGDPNRLFRMCHGRTVLTPHEGEFARLFPDLSQSKRGTMSKIDAARAAAYRAGCVVLLKGEDTVIAQPDGGASLHSATGKRAVPWLASAGAGDVLAGLIAGLAAQELAPDLFCSVEAAVWLHCDAANRYGPGLIAEDLPDLLPAVWAACDTKETS